MMGWFNENWPVIVGTVLGTFAHFGNILLTGKMPSWFQVVGFVLQLGLVIVAAVVVTDLLGLKQESHKMLASGSLAVSAHEIVNFIKRYGWRRLLRPWIDADDLQSVETDNKVKKL